MRSVAFIWKTLLEGLTIILALPLTLWAQTNDETDRQAIAAVIDRFVASQIQACTGS